jgi:hypothetical protein
MIFGDMINGQGNEILRPGVKLYDIVDLKIQ